MFTYKFSPLISKMNLVFYFTYKHVLERIQIDQYIFFKVYLLILSKSPCEVGKKYRVKASVRAKREKELERIKTFKKKKKKRSSNTVLETK